MAIWGKRKTTKKEELQHTQADDIIQIQKSFGRLHWHVNSMTGSQKEYFSHLIRSDMV